MITIDETLKEKVRKYCIEALGPHPCGVYADYEDITYGSDTVSVYTDSARDSDNNEILPGIDYELSFGASKMVIVPDDEDFVIKVEVTATVDKEGNVIQEMNPYDSILEKEACIVDRISDKAALGFFPVQKIFKHGEIDIYVQEKFDRQIREYEYTTDKNVEDESIKYNKFADARWGYCSGNRDLNAKEGENEVWGRSRRVQYFYERFKSVVKESEVKMIDELTEINDFGSDSIIIYDNWIKRYGFETAKEILQSISDEDIHDLHGGNIAYDKSGVIKLSDFGGYDDNEHWCLTEYGDKYINGEEEEEVECRSVSSVMNSGSTTSHSCSRTSHS